jgi:undecaprenyl-diphosphatase
VNCGHARDASCAFSFVAHLSWLEAIVIGGLQGVAELFPVSSLGHSILVPAVIGGTWAKDLDVSAPESPYLAFVVGLHVATAVALIIYFWQDWLRIVRGLVTSIVRREVVDADQRLAWLLVVATIPVGVSGVLLEHVFRVYLSKPVPTAAFLAVNGVVLLLAGAAAPPRRDTRGRYGLGGRGGGRSSTGSTSGAFYGADRNGAGGGAAAGYQPVRSRDGGRADQGTLARRRGASVVPAGHAGDPRRGSAQAGRPRGALGRWHPTAGPRGQPAVRPGRLLSVRFLTRWFETRSMVPFGIYCLIAGLGCLAWFTLR